MINSTLIWFLVLPVVAAVAIWFFTGRRREGLIGGGIYILVAALAIGACFAISKGVATSDTEIWNGKITGKDRVHGSYVRSYECNCTETCSGTGAQRSCSKSCQTCYEDHYTVHWNAASTIGTFGIDSKDWTSRAVYAVPDPARYTAVVVGEHCARANSYTNYVQAVPNSLFTPSAQSLKERFANLIPAYPDATHDIYRHAKFFTPGYVTPDAAAWNASLGELLKDRGPKKQVNALVVIAKTNDPNYVYALRDAWEGANKNDVVLVIGSAAWPKIDFVDVISWTSAELFKVQLRDSVLATGTIQREPILGILAAQIDTNFVRRRMREFAYLEAEIDPPTWMLIALVVLLVGGAVGTVYLVNNQSFRPRAYRM